MGGMKGSGWTGLGGFIAKWPVGLAFLVFLLLTAYGNLALVGLETRWPGLIIMLAVTAVVFLLTMKSEGGRLFVPLLVGFSLVIHAIWALSLRTQPVSDFKTLLSSAILFAEGDKSAYMNRYYATWAYQTGFSLYEALVVRLFGSAHAISVLKVLNGCWLTLTNLMIYLLGRRIAGERAGRTVALLFFLYPGTWSLSTLLTNQFMGTALMLSGIALCLLVPDKAWHVLPLGGTLLAVSNAIRSDAVIAAIAVSMAFLLLPQHAMRSIGRRPVDGKRHTAVSGRDFQDSGGPCRNSFASGLARAALVIFSFLGMGMLLSWSLAASGVNPMGLGNGFPAWKLIAGLNEESGGQYSQKDNDEIFFGIHLNPDLPAAEKKERETAILRQRLQKSPEAWLKLLLDKSATLWTSQDDLHWAFSHLEDKSWDLNLFGKPVNIQSAGLVAFLRGTERGAFLILLLLCILAGLPWRRGAETTDPRPGLCFILMLLAMAVLYLFVEVQLRYRIIFMPAFFIVAAPGSELLHRMLGGLWHGNAQSEKR